MDDDVSHVMITKEQFDSFRKDSLMLRALESSGVDNWDWYHEAYTEYLSMLKEAGFEVDD